MPGSFNFEPQNVSQILLKFDMEDIHQQLLKISSCRPCRSLMNPNLRKAISSRLHIGSSHKTFHSFCFDSLCKTASVKYFRFQWSWPTMKPTSCMDTHTHVSVCLYMSLWVKFHRLFWNSIRKTSTKSCQEITGFRSINWWPFFNNIRPMVFIQWYKYTLLRQRQHFLIYL